MDVGPRVHGAQQLSAWRRRARALVEAACSCLIGHSELNKLCSSMDRWFSDPRTMTTSGGIAQGICACVGISCSTLDSVEMVPGKKRGGLRGSRNLRRMCWVEEVQVTLASKCTGERSIGPMHLL